MSDNDVEIRGLDELKRKLTPEIMDRPMRDFLTSAAIVVQNKARDRAPVDTGRLAGSIVYELDSGTPPLWARVGPMGKDSGETSVYGSILDASGRHHYRGGKAAGKASARAVAQGKSRGGVGIASRLGSKTKGWFSDTPGQVKDQVAELLRNMGDEIEKAFQR